MRRLSSNSILHIAHRGNYEASIATITETVNTMSKWRRCGRITAKKVGSVVRRELGSRPVRRAAGFFVVLDRVAQTALHRAARSLGLLAEDESACRWCNQNLPAMELFLSMKLSKETREKLRDFFFSKASRRKWTDSASIPVDWRPVGTNENHLQDDFVRARDSIKGL